jgi:chromo domain-containing protein 1
MFKVNPRASFEAASVAPDGEESDDNISLTSTVSGHDPDQEFEVENILAEELFNGKMHYLIEWTGFPLHQCTWEPESNLGSELKATWEEDKAKHASGELEPFDIQKYIDATEEAKNAKAERHNRRNKKRKKLGLPLTEPFPGQDSSDEEAVEEAGVNPEDPEPSQKTRPPIQQKIFKGAPDAQLDLPSISATVSSSSGAQNQANKRPSLGRQESQTDASSSTKGKQTAAQPQTTGHQGTARRPSKAATDVLPELRTRPASSIPTATTGPSAKPSLGARKTLTARKSTAQPTGNIFTSGKMRKQRASLKDVMSDPTREPKLFDKHRYRRKAELRSRDKEDIAPDVSQLDLIDLRSKQTIRRQSSGGSVLSPTQLTPQEEAPSPFEHQLPQRSALVNPRPALADPDAAPPKKKRKSVRWDDGALFVQEPDQMDVDGSATRGPSRILRSPPPAQQSPSLAQSQNQWTPSIQSFQNLDKKLTVGQSSVEVTFNRLPRERLHQPAWLTNFVAKETLQFTHTCFARIAAHKIGGLIQEPLASGTIVPKHPGPSLDRLAEYLTAGLLALYCAQAEFNVLVYPTKCDEWKDVPLNQDPTSLSEAALGYFIFAPWQDSTLMLPPLALLSESQPALEDSMAKANKDHRSARALMMRRLFEFDYHRLLPAVSKSPIHNFFLAIPKSRREIGESLFHWLRASNPACEIFTSHQAGGWDAFRTRVEPPNGVPGVVIIHETLAWSLRRFPNLAKYLLTRNDEFWCISEPVHGLPLYPSISAPEHTVAPGDIRFTRLFPYRTAILLTPSFLVSEPRRALRFFEWFRKWEGNFHYRLVTAFNIHEYLSELADERYHARQELWNSADDTQPELEANLSGLSREECRCRYVVAEMAQDLHIARVAHAGPFAHDEENGQLVYADPSIDPNDEQSLVNWFGWWSTLRADQFRKFHVIGSSKTIKAQGSRRGECRIRIPKYTKVTLNDPDAVLEVLQERHDQLEGPEADANGGDPNMHMAANGNKRIGFIQGPWAFRSDLIQREDSACFTQYLDSLTVLDGFRSQWVLYKYPVSWVDLSMAEHFGDFSARFPRIHDWFTYTFPFGACYHRDNANRSADGSRQVGPHRGFNTYVGFFYTIDKEGDPLPPPKPLERHPWIAIYRPVNPHYKPHRRCEVIIWDPAARTRYPNGQAPAEKDLIFMQRQLIQHVREHGDEKNHGTWLDQVWFGGWDWPESCGSPCPIDVTLRFLREMLSNIREYLPAPEHVMETTGFRRVRLGSASPSTTDPANQTTTATAPPPKPDSPLFVEQEDQPMDLDSDSDYKDSASSDNEEEDKDARIIFHPPRGYTTTTNNNPKHPWNQQAQSGSTIRSRCRNRLYEEARLARTRRAVASDAAPPSHMWYRFVPTLDWYREQREEGRGFAHVNVDCWERVFVSLKIADGGSASVAAAAAGGVATVAVRSLGGGEGSGSGHASEHESGHGENGGGNANGNERGGVMASGYRRG